MPWGVFLFLLVPFLLAQHDLNRSLERRDEVNVSQDELLERVTEGDPARQVAFPLLAAFGLFVLIRGGAELRIHGLLGCLVLLLLVWTMASVAWSEAFWQTAKRLVVLVAMCLGAAAVTHRFSLRHLGLWLFSTSLIYLLLGLGAEVGLGVFQPWSGDQRFSGTLHPNQQGVNCGLLAIAGVAGAATARRGRALLLVGAVLGLIFLASTRSRTAFLSTNLALLAFWILVLRPGRRFMLFGTLLVSVCLALLFVDTTGPVMRKVVYLGREESDTSRLPIWEESLSYLTGRSLVGYGYQGFWTPRRVDEISDSQHWGVGEAHSSYVTMLLELGLVGVTLFVLVLLGSLVRAIHRHRATGDPGYALLAALLVFSILHGILESGAVLATHQSFVTMIAVAHLACHRPDDVTRRPRSTP